jgi:hypothetical protein
MASSAGRLDFLFFLPEANDARNNLKLVDIEDMEKKDVVRGFHPMAACDENVTELAMIFMEENNLTMPYIQLMAR